MFTKSAYRQEITYWAPLPGDDGFGKKNLAAPISILGRWEDKQEQVVTAKGQTTISKAEIYVKESQPLDIDGFLFLGTSSATDPRGVDGAFQIIQSMRVPDLRNLDAQVCAII